jgi:hypothetical protein
MAARQSAGGKMAVRRVPLSEKVVRSNLVRGAEDLMYRPRAVSPRLR